MISPRGNPPLLVNSIGNVVFFSGGAPIQEDPGRLFQGEPTEIEVTRLGKGALGGKAVLTWRSCDQFFVGKRKQQL